ncbi:uncharacterized protein LOC105230848 [Bactrocera dorsalis]|uniref:Uncharacterized protein LOC105230848 n=2 Tax=Bactrocera dorsalis TaxID=27457 RepID=A0A6I9VG29_BACDO|nr:uncharacterized protein LOC105230848 [Bactrocera dorsalis]
MGRRCCVTGCNSTSRLPEHHGVTYHSFPLDANIRAIWLRNTRLSSERQITKSVLVCSRHFRRIDFQPQRSGKYLLKQRVFPTVFPWGKVDPTQVESDLEDLKNNSMNTSSLTNQSTEDATKATVEAKVAQIMAETAERSAAKANANAVKDDVETASPVTTPVAASPAAVKFEPVTSFNPGARLEAQDFDGVWHAARVVEVDNDDREVLIKFERSGKVKSAVVGTEEWIPMNSTRLRQKVSTKPVPVFELEEKCMARWSGPRKFPGTIKKILGNDMYEVLFDDGYVKNVRAVHINKILPLDPELQAPISSSPTIPSTPQTPSTNLSDTSALKTPNTESPLPVTSSSTSGKKRASSGSRKDWPLLDLANLDLSSLNLPDIPKDGEWTCHWVNDQPIGKEGYLIVGEHRKPTVIVEDWRLPPGWVKHMYQRSNVLGKWDVILVTPGGKRFRSKADLKIFLEEQGQVYNPDIYDFSIHRRRAKDINAYVYTPDYTPQPPPKPKALETTIAAMDAASVKAATTALAVSTSQYIETPVASAEPPAELMTPTLARGSPLKDVTMDIIDNADTVSGRSVDANLPAEDGYAYIGGLKVQIINNLFRCPQEGCLKNFRKEDHLQIHVKHYHPDLNKLLGSCPKMLDLAEKRTHTKPDQHEPAPRNQIPNQQFFAKLHQQDLLQTRAHRRSAGTHAVTTGGIPQSTVTTTDLKCEADNKMETDADAETSQISVGLNDTLLNSSAQDSHNTTAVEATVATSITMDDSLSDISGIPIKRSRMSPNKRTLGSRKSNRQRTTKRYLTAAQTSAGTSLLPVVTGDNSFGVSEFEETRHSFNATPDAKVVEVGKKRKSSGAPVTSMSSLDSPVTADSGSSSFPPLLAPASNETDGITGVTSVNNPQYIKENGEIIKIVSMRQEEIINCLCSYGEEDGLMIQCELCLCWQHGICNGIDKEVDVPEKYVCYICRNPQRGRESMRFKHDQDWLYDGKLPVANYHIANPNLPKRFGFLKKSHVLTGNLVELNRFMHSLRVKMNIVNNRCHPKLYLWAKKWEEDIAQQSIKSDIKSDQDIKIEDAEIGSKVLSAKVSPTKKIKSEPTTPTPAHPIPNIPQPEAPIDPVECQHRLMEHIKIQQNLVLKRLDDIENEIDELESQDDLIDLKDADYKSTKDVLATFIKELDVMKQLAKLNALENTKQTMKNAVTAK